MRRLTPSIPLLAVLLSILLHGAVLVPAIGLFPHADPDRRDPDQPAQVALLPVEVEGEAADTTPPAQASRENTPADAAPAEAAQPAEPAAARPAAQPDTTPPTAAEPDAPAPGSDHAEGVPPTQPTPSAAASSPAVEASATPAPAAPASQALTLSLSGTDSASNALASGAAVIPASPDDRERNRPPVYPPEAVRRGQQGTVVVVVHVSPMGLAESGNILTSSGYPLLDRAALDAVMAWRFRPAIRDGQPIPFDMSMQFIFSMR